MSETREMQERLVRERLDLLQRVLNVRGPANAIQDDADDPYFVGVWEAQAVPRSIDLAQDSLILFLALHLGPFGLEAILADRYATAGLTKFLIADDLRIWRELENYLKWRKPRAKPGPRPKDGKYKGDVMSELRAKGLTYGQIAREVYRDPSKSNRVSATLSQRKKKLSA